jgi:HK97 family phage major capsid protein
MIDSDELINLTNDLRGIYRHRTAFVMNSKTAGYIRKLTDSNSQYLWAQGLADGNAPTINGFPLHVDENCPDVAADAEPFLTVQPFQLHEI